jgi:predicted transcriptional regulator
MISVPSQKGVGFAALRWTWSPCLTTERVRLVQAVRRKRLSISSLAEELGRNRGAVTRDVKKLAGLGLGAYVSSAIRATLSCRWSSRWLTSLARF